MSFSSCRETCKQCSGVSEIEQYVDGILDSSLTFEIPETEYCEETLEMIDTGKTIESESTFGSVKTVTKITYTCN